MKKDAWNRCAGCGRFIGWDEFTCDPQKARSIYVAPSSYVSDEVVEIWHVKCHQK